MDVWWAATSTTSGRFVPGDTASSLASLRERFVELRLDGRGYIEVRAEAQFPVLTLGLMDDVAVIHLMASVESISLLVADEPAVADVEVPVMDELVEFSAVYAVELDRAWRVVEEFAHNGDISELGQWREL